MDYYSYCDGSSFWDLVENNPFWEELCVSQERGNKKWNLTEDNPFLEELYIAQEKRKEEMKIKKKEDDALNKIAEKYNYIFNTDILLKSGLKRYEGKKLDKKKRSKRIKIR